MQVTAYTDIDAFVALKDEWNPLVRMSAMDTIFATWEWHSTWWDAYHPGDLLIFAVRDDAQKLVGIGSFFIEIHAELGRMLRIVGSEDVTDYMDVIVSLQDSTSIYDALASAFVQHRARFDLIDLSNVVPDSPTYQLFPEILRQHGFEVEIQQQETCPTITLPSTFEDYLESLESKERSELRRKLRRAEGSGDMGWYVVSSEHSLDDELQRFLKLMGASHPAKARFLENPQHMAFFKNFMPIAFERGWLHLNFETVEGEAIAAYLNFDYNNDILVYNSGLEPNKFGSLSPGIVLLARNIASAIELKKRHFNFLRGDEVYKYKLGGKDSPIYNIRAH